MRISFIRNSRVVAQPVVAKDGSYTVSLPAGGYSVALSNHNRTQPVGRFAPSWVRIIAGRTRTVDFSLDTGLR